MANVRRRRIVLALCACVLALGAIVLLFIPRRGVVRNQSRHVVWVVDTDNGYAVAHLLGPDRQSPRTLDADGVRCLDGTPIEGHDSWWKARDVSVAHLTEEAGTVQLSCIACSAVQDDEFGSSVRYDRSPDWGEPLHE